MHLSTPHRIAYCQDILMAKSVARVHMVRGVFHHTHLLACLLTPAYPPTPQSSCTECRGVTLAALRLQA